MDVSTTARHDAPARGVVSFTVLALALVLGLNLALGLLALGLIKTGAPVI